MNRELAIVYMIGRSDTLVNSSSFSKPFLFESSSSNATWTYRDQTELGAQQQCFNVCEAVRVNGKSDEVKKICLNNLRDQPLCAFFVELPKFFAADESVLQMSMHL